MSENLPEPGDVVGGKYLVERVLGRGGMGTVYVVSHRVTGKRLALKCLLPEHQADEDIVRRFVREAQAAGRIQHRHVVDVFDVGQDGPVLYMVMPLLEGKPLSNLLREDTLTLEETLGILVRAMEGVGAAHAQGIIHRDLKPDNIFVCIGPSGRHDDPRVLDFGISKRDDEMLSNLTRSGVMMGTPYYMSFEQINSQRDLDQRVDVYAMGVIVYEAIAGILPHVAESIGQLAIRMMGTAPPHLATLRPDLPQGLAEVVMKAIARDRDERFPSMHAFAEALRPYHVQGRSSLVPDGAGTPLRISRHSMAERSQGEDATVPMRSPVPQPLRVTTTGSPPRMLRGGMGEHTPPRVIAPSSGSGLWLGLVGFAAVAFGVLFWLFRPQAEPPAVEKPAPVAQVAPEAPKPAQPAPAARAAELADALEEPAAEADQLDERPSDAEKPTKHRRKRRKVVRTVATPDGKPRSVVLFIEEDAGTAETAPGEAVAAEQGAPVEEPKVPANDQKAQPAETAPAQPGSGDEGRPDPSGPK